MSNNSPFNTFFLMFQSNADKVIKDNQKVKKSTDEITDSFNDADEASNKFGKSLGKAIDGLANAGATWAVFNMFKAGVVNAQQFNSQLQTMADLTNQNFQNLKALSQVSEALGGSKNGALNDYNSMQSTLPRGTKPKPLDQFYGDVRTRMKQYGITDPYEKAQYLRSIGFSDPGTLRLLSMNDSDYADRTAKSRQVTDVPANTGRVAQSFTASASDYAASKDNGMSRVGDSVLPALGGGANALSKSAGASTIFSTGFSILKVAGASAAAQWFLGLLGAGGAETVGAGVVGAASMFTGVGEAALIGGGLYASYRGLKYLRQNYDNNGKPISSSLTGNIKDNLDPMSYFMSLGYSKDGAAGILGNLKRENSKMDPSLHHMDSNGRMAYGLAQWNDPGRIAAIYKATGIDVKNSSYNDQLKAIAWEMKNGDIGFNDSKYRGLVGGDKTGNYFSRKFERPGDSIREAMLRGRNALSIAANAAPYAGSGASVKIDKIEINTQATDAKGIASGISQELYSQMNVLAANHDDGVQK